MVEIGKSFFAGILASHRDGLLTLAHVAAEKVTPRDFCASPSLARRMSSGEMLPEMKAAEE